MTTRNEAADGRGGSLVQDEFHDEGMLHGGWQIITADLEHPFVIGDAPVVTMERTEDNRLYFGMGFARPNAEVFLPVSLTPASTFCLKLFVPDSRVSLYRWRSTWRRPHSQQVLLRQHKQNRNRCGTTAGDRGRLKQVAKSQPRLIIHTTATNRANATKTTKTPQITCGRDSSPDGRLQRRWEAENLGVS
jgi:hypothetical protein